MAYANSKKASIDAMQQLPTEDDIAFFEQHGFFISQRILPDELIEEALFGIERYYRGERDHFLPISGGFLDWREEHGERLRINDYVSLQNDELRELVAWPPLAAIAARLARASSIRLFHDQLISKPPTDGSETAIGWHVDQSYWNTCTSRRMLTAWIPLVPITIDMGPLTFIDGSHRWHGNEWMTTFTDRDLDKLESKIQAAGNDIKKVPVLIKPGCVSYHHGSTIHGSSANRGDRARIALTVHFQDGDNAYRPYTDCRGKEALHVNDVVCRKRDDGSPDYADPDICPLLWQDPSKG